MQTFVSRSSGNLLRAVHTVRIKPVHLCNASLSIAYALCT
jgi:hypothetical protein